MLSTNHSHMHRGTRVQGVLLQLGDKVDHDHEIQKKHADPDCRHLLQYFIELKET
jgi:hypothetical protein